MPDVDGDDDDNIFDDVSVIKVNGTEKKSRNLSGFFSFLKTCIRIHQYQPGTNLVFIIFFLLFFQNINLNVFFRLSKGLHEDSEKNKEKTNDTKIET